MGADCGGKEMAVSKILRRMERLPNVESRDEWKPGPWDDEPDLVEWRHDESGYPCLIVRNNFGALCGYVGVPPEHPLHGKGMLDAEVTDLDVHGGVTYGHECAGDICHVARPGEPEDVWWVGFDCAHAFDAVPGISMLCGRSDEARRYRSMGYVQDQVESLARQLSNPPLPPLPGAREDE